MDRCGEARLWISEDGSIPPEAGEYGRVGVLSTGDCTRTSRVQNTGSAQAYCRSSLSHRLCLRRNGWNGAGKSSREGRAPHGPQAILPRLAALKFQKKGVKKWEHEECTMSVCLRPGSTIDLLTGSVSERHDSVGSRRQRLLTLVRDHRTLLNRGPSGKRELENDEAASSRHAPESIPPDGRRGGPSRLDGGSSGWEHRQGRSSGWFGIR